MLDQSYIQWENSNSIRKYPFTEDSSMISTDGIMLPDNIISDALVVVPNSISNVYLANVRIGSDIISAAFKSETAGIASVFVSKANFTPFSTYQLDTFEDGVSGYVSFGDISWPDLPTTYTFSTTAKLETRAVIKIASPKITEFYDPDSGERITGLVELNLPEIVECSIVDSENEHVVTLRLTDAGRLQLATPCNVSSDTTICGTPVIRTINGIAPNRDGEILLRFI